MIDFFKRLDKYIEYSGLNDNKVTVQANISNGLIGKARKRGSLSLENISKILFTFDDLNAQWLLTGEGKMLKSGSAGEGNDEVLAENARLKEKIKSLEEMKQLQQELITSLKQQLGNAHAHSSKAS